MAFIEVNQENFDAVTAEAFEAGNIVILKFGSEWCEPCHALECELEEIDEAHDDIVILSIDCDEESALTEMFGVYELPTMVIFKDKNTPLYHAPGVLLADDILQIIRA